MFRTHFEKELTDKNVNYKEDEFTEFVFDSEDILDAFTKASNRVKHFPSSKYEFIEVEMEINIPIKNPPRNPITDMISIIRMLRGR